jgi:hypothetical protein
MKLKIIALSWIVFVLAACTTTGGPAGTPNPSDQAYPHDNSNTTIDTPYPEPGGEAPAGARDPYPDPLEPIPGEENMNRGEVFIDESGIIILESMPPQFELRIVGNLPTPCHRLRAVVSQPDDQNNIQVDVYTLVNPEEICTQVLQPFDTGIRLGSFTPGKYTVLLNGEKVGEIEAPS